jgi:protein-tyrosine phosphatase
MAEFIDLHCHWLVGLDDGAPNFAESQAMLRGLRALGFGEVVATPHIRPGLFNNDRPTIAHAFAAQVPAVEAEVREGLPRLSLSAEHFFCDEVYQLILDGAALPYPGAQAILLEFYDSDFPRSLDQLLGGLRRSGVVPVIAHPERYRSLWHDPSPLERLLDLGAVALLDSAALIGKYGSAAKRAARTFLADGWYAAACSDAHRASDLAQVADGMSWIRKQFGEAELGVLFGDGPRAILRGMQPFEG